MYAVIQTGGKQYRIEEGARLRVEKLDAEEGSTVEIDKILMIGEGGSVTIGKPYVENSKVKAKVTAQGRKNKIKIIKFKRRKNYLKRQGHRQRYTELEITAIEA